MSTYTKAKLSGSTNGKQIKVVAIATLGTTIHTAVSGTAAWDEIWIYACNTDSVTRTLTLEWGEATSPDGHIVLSLPAQNSLVLVAPGLLLQNSLVVTAFASAANVVVINGFVNQIT